MFQADSDFGCFLALLGAYVGLQYLYENLKSPFETIWSVMFGSKVSLSERYGPWAVITGSSDGIGKEYAKNLARKGMNIMLISRTESKLIEVAQEIRSKYGVQADWLSVDFSEDTKAYEKIGNKLYNMDIGILVNNVGMAHEHPLAFELIPKKDLEQSILVNIYPTVMLTHMLLPEMKRRGRGIVVNVTSCSGFLAIPYVTMYAASKAFLNSLTLALQRELKGTGVECQLVTPMFVDTNMSQQWHSLGLWQLVSVNVERYTRMAVWMLGRAEHTTGYWVHALQISLLRIAPRWTLTNLMGMLTGYARGMFSKQT